MTSTPIPEAVARLRASFDAGHTRDLEWRRRQLRALAGMIEQNGPAFEEALAADLGKPALESQLTELRLVVAEANLAVKRLRRWLRPQRVGLPMALLPGSARIIREPKGVVLVIAPWNYPVQLALVPLLGALAAGNTVVLKPSELAPATSALLARLIPRHLDPHAVAVVEGAIPEATELLAQTFDHIFYTGGPRAAQAVALAAAQHLTPVTLELGGKSPAWVDGSTSLRTVADRLAWGKFLNAGQTCVAPDYVLATPEVADQLVVELRASIERMFGADPSSSPDYARLVSEAAYERLTGLLDGAVPAIGGHGDRAQRYLAPTVLADVDPAHPLMAEEIFGPILPIVRVSGPTEAVEFVRSRPKPLALYVFSRFSGVIRAFEQGTSSGALGLNVPVAHLSAPGLPFGGVGASGIGAYHGEHSIRTFSHERAVLSKPLWPDTIRLVLPPYGKSAEFVAKRLMK